ncbi:hypothetical protein FSP39_024056 [Pinctada imbricata]|uniref:Uncharacterized protein n=1 Tax=Pinctada imbricata TaxID=66713 RepID=A0AA89BMY7_PINIB|nr:hypothetical protein FSP39_024056 [Pinctada imbricata]
MNKCVIDVPTLLPPAWKLADDHGVQACSVLHKRDKHKNVSVMVNKWSNYFLNLTEKFKPDLYTMNTSYACHETFSEGFASNIHRILNYKVMRNAPCIVQDFAVNRRKFIRDRSLSLGNRLIFPVIVTASSSDHFYETQALLWSINARLRPLFHNIKVVLYDIGFTESESQRMRDNCGCEVRKFDFDSFPEHVRDAKTYAWKPLVILEAIYEFEFIVWVDASIRFKGYRSDWKKLLEKARETGILLQQNPKWKVKDQTKPDTFRILEEPECLFDYPELESGWILIQRNWFTMNVIIQPWCACALTKHCLTHPFPTYLKSCSKDLWKFLMNTRCHRFDQSVLNIILIRIFNKYRKLVEFDRSSLGTIERGTFRHTF